VGALVGLAFALSVAQAGAPSGGIDGLVSTERGTALARVALVVRDARERVVARRTSGDDGRFSVVDLPPGRYRLTVSLSEFSTADQRVVVEEGRTTAVEIHLQPALEAVAVVSQTEVLTTGNALAADEAMASRELDQFVPGTGLQSAVRMFASVMATPNGVNIKGGRPDQVGVQLEAGSLVDPSSAIAHVPLPDDAITSVTVLPNPYSVEYGRFSSGLLTIQTRRAGDRWRFQFNRLAPIIRNNRGRFFSYRIDEFRPRYAIGGPLVAGRLFFEQTGQVRFSSSDVPSRPENERRESKSLSSFTRLDANLSPRHTVVATVGFFPGVTSSANLGTFTPPEATVDLHTVAWQAAVIERARWTGGTIAESTLHVLQSTTDVFPQGTALMELRPENTLGSFFNRQRRDSTSLQLVEAVTVSRDGRWGSHTFKFGVDALASGYDGTSDSRPVLIERTDGTLARRLDYSGATRQSVSSVDVAAFAQDRLQLGPRWTVDLGARLDRDGIVDRVNVSPRIGSALQLTSSGNTTLRGGFGLFHGRTPSTVGAFSSYPSYVDRRYGVDGVTPLTAPMSVALVTAPDLETAHTRTWDVGVEHRLNPDWSFHATFISRDARGEFIVTPPTATAAAPVGELLLSSAGRSSYRDVELGAHFTRSARIDIETLYDWSSARGDLNELTTFFDTIAAPVVGANAYGPLGVDVPHRLFVRGRMLATPRWLLLGVFDWKTGLPFSTVNEALDFVGLRNDRRFPNYARLELGTEYRMKILKWQPWAGVRLTNVFDAFLPSDVQANFGSPFFGQFYNSEDRHFRIYLRFGR
jgi:TonB dependent receptor/Carboxypeptidase regulatory-like domain